MVFENGRSRCHSLEMLFLSMRLEHYEDVQIYGITSMFHRLLMFLVWFHLQMLQKKKCEGTHFQTQIIVSFLVKIKCKLQLSSCMCQCSLQFPPRQLCPPVVANLVNLFYSCVQQNVWFFYFLRFCIVSTCIFWTMKIVSLYLLERWCTTCYFSRWVCGF